MNRFTKFYLFKFYWFQQRKRR